MTTGLTHASCTLEQRTEKDAYGFLDLVHPSEEWEARGHKAMELLVGERGEESTYE